MFEHQSGIQVVIGESTRSPDCDEGTVIARIAGATKDFCTAPGNMVLIAVNGDILGTIVDS